MKDHLNALIEELMGLLRTSEENVLTLRKAHALLPGSEDISRQIVFEQGIQRGICHAANVLRTARNNPTNSAP